MVNIRLALVTTWQSDSMSTDRLKPKTNPADIKHSPVITEYDRANFATYLIVHDARKDGLTDTQIVQMLWGSPGLLDSSWIVDHHLKRAQWFITTGYLHLLAESPETREESLDALTASGSMSEAERLFLDTPAGEKFWPKPKH